MMTVSGDGDITVSYCTAVHTIIVVHVNKIVKKISYMDLIICDKSYYTTYSTGTYIHHLVESISCDTGLTNECNLAPTDNNLSNHDIVHFVQSDTPLVHSILLERSHKQRSFEHTVQCILYDMRSLVFQYIHY
jgi:hypothetical protein